MMTGRQKLAALLAVKSKEQGLPPKRDHHKKKDLGEQLVDLAKDGKYKQVGIETKGDLLKDTSPKHFGAMPKFNKLKSLLKI